MSTRKRATRGRQPDILEHVTARVPRPQAVWETRDQRPLNGDGPDAFLHIARVRVPLEQAPKDSENHVAAWHERRLGRFIADDPEDRLEMEVADGHVELRVLVLSSMAEPSGEDLAFAEGTLNEAWVTVLLGPARS